MASYQAVSNSEKIKYFKICRKNPQAIYSGEQNWAVNTFRITSKKKVK